MLIRATDYDNILLKDSVFLRLGLIISCLSIVLHASSLVLLDSNFIDWIYKGWEFKPLRMTGDRVSFALGGMGYLSFPHLSSPLMAKVMMETRNLFPMQVPMRMRLLCSIVN